MRRASALLPKVVSFRNELVTYGNFLSKGQNQAAGRIRPSLNMQWGELETDLSRLGMVTRYNQSGHSFPLITMALRVPNGFTNEDILEDLHMATSQLETMIGKLQRSMEEGSPIRHSLRMSLFVFTFIAGWIVRHYQDRMLLLRHLPAATTWHIGKVLLVAVSLGASSIAGNLFAGIVQADGWRAGLRRYPIRFLMYLFLSLGLLVLAGIVADQ